MGIDWSQFICLAADVSEHMLFLANDELLITAMSSNKFIVLIMETCCMCLGSVMLLYLL